MFKMSSHEYLKINYGQKKGQKSNCQFDYEPPKVKNHPNLLACKWHATHLWKDFDKGYNFFLDLILIKGLYKMLWASTITGISIWES
jgi:hypothetical protein